jgi:peptidoglycan/xylan/chitin deacetylase (PgdA/CDA1 family)
MAAPALRRAAEAVLVRSGAGALARRRVRGRTLTLAYHNVVPDRLCPVGDRSLHLPLSDFRNQLDLLARHFEVVPLAATRAPHTGGRPRAVITFDDAYRGAVTLGVEELNRRGLPATIFVAPGLLGEQTFWWDEVGAAADDHVVPPEVRELALWTWQGRGDLVRARVAERGLGLDPGALPPEARTATESELLNALNGGGIRLGSHSWSHPNLAALEQTMVQEELTRSLAWLRERYPAATDPWIAYPYGPDSALVHEAARGAGYEAGLRIAGRWLMPGALPRFDTPRWNIPAGITAHGFALRLADFPGL